MFVTTQLPPMAMCSIHSHASSCASAQKAVKVDSARFYLGNVASSLENSQPAVVTLLSEPPKLLCSYLYLLRDEADKKKSTFVSTFKAIFVIIGNFA